MKAFMDQDFLLSGDTAKRLYHEYAAKMPVLDYHCHINPEEIAKDRKYENITQIWLGGDHYKWRLMRSCGVAERFITGDASDREKFMKWAEVLGKAIGNPLYHWSHLELQRYFGYHGILNRHTAAEVWDLCNEKLAQASMSVRNLIRQSGVTLICTTDDPVDSLEWHRRIAADESCAVQVLPAWRPDKAMNIEKADFTAYLARLGTVSGVPIDSFAALRAALCRRMDFFAANGSRVSDHALAYVMYVPTEKAEPADGMPSGKVDEIEAIFRRRLNGEVLSDEEVLKFKTAFMMFAGKEYARRDWVMQLHFGCKRDNNTLMFERLGADTGFDCINNHTPSAQLADFLNGLAREGALPKTILYSLNPHDNQAIGTVLGCFQEGSVRADWEGSSETGSENRLAGKIQQGSAWWFNDHKQGMREQLLSLAALGNLAGFVGMLTDSRSFLSYPRHEYFRRILCDLIGELVDQGEFPADWETLKEIVQDISYGNAVRYFGFAGLVPTGYYG